MRQLLCALLVFSLMALPVLAGAQQDFAPDPGYVLASADREVRTCFTPDSETWQTLNQLVAMGDYQVIGCWVLQRGLWRHYFIEGDKPTWVVETLREGDAAALAAQPLAPWGLSGGQVLAALATKPSERNPTALRTWLLTFYLEPGQAPLLVARYLIHKGAYDLDEDIDGVICREAYCLDFFGDGGLAFVLPWSYSTLGRYRLKYFGADVIHVGELGQVTLFGDNVSLPDYDRCCAPVTVSDLDADGKWELQAQFELMPGGYLACFQLEPNLKRHDWAVKYDPDQPFYARQREFYQGFVQRLMALANEGLSDNARVEEYGGDKRYYILFDGSDYEITDLVDHGNVDLGSLVDFDQAVLYVNRLVMRGQ